MSSKTPWVYQGNAAMLVDLYELTMAASYRSQGRDASATFDLLVRSLPEERSFLVGCGLADALDYLETMAFDSEALAYLDRLGMFDDAFLSYLADFSFTGDVWAIPEGEIVFPEEPIVRVTGPLVEAQIVETFLLNCIGFQTLIASKAARVALACGDRQFVDFSPRRDHGADAALKAARAAYIGGASATSNVLAGSAYGIPLSGTMAHSYVMSFEDETGAFRSFARDFPVHSVLLIDTFDTIEGAKHAALVGREMKERGQDLAGVRIDSGDLISASKKVREVLDGAGLADTKIIVSGDLDEHRIAGILAEGGPVDSFGVGTQLGTSGDAPSLGFIYKLVADDGGPKIKLSAEKVTLPGIKQVYRFMNETTFDHDVIAFEDEEVEGGEPLLVHVMKEGRVAGPDEDIEVARQRCASRLARLPSNLRDLDNAGSYRVSKSAKLEQLVADLKERF